MNRDLGLGLSRTWRALNGYELQILNLVAVYGILAISLNIIYGFTGMFSLGHAGFMAIGAYVSALCVLTPDQKEMMWLIEEILPPLATLYTPFWVSVILGGLVATVFALLIGIPVLRLGGDYLG
ncbi:MAG: branched-chain amino acid ABC transporter permease, partial [Mailhella sp.]|nr:branched-chain amino acid ABC transporter permease [Mailhella sp.]